MNQLADTDVCVLAYARTPIGSFGGQLKPFTAVQPGSAAIKGAMAWCSTLTAADIDEVTELFCVQLRFATG
jgi:acetyl-CoA acetyltransferase